MTLRREARPPSDKMAFELIPASLACYAIPRGRCWSGYGHWGYGHPGYQTEDLEGVVFVDGSWRCVPECQYLEVLCTVHRQGYFL